MWTHVLSMPTRMPGCSSGETNQVSEPMRLVFLLVPFLVAILDSMEASPWNHYPNGIVPRDCESQLAYIFSKEENNWRVWRVCSIFLIFFSEISLDFVSKKATRCRQTDLQWYRLFSLTADCSKTHDIKYSSTWCCSCTCSLMWAWSRIFFSISAMIGLMGSEQDLYWFHDERLTGSELKQVDDQRAPREKHLMQKNILNTAQLSCWQHKLILTFTGWWTKLWTCNPLLLWKCFINQLLVLISPWITVPQAVRAWSRKSFSLCNFNMQFVYYSESGS